MESITLPPVPLPGGFCGDVFGWDHGDFSFCFQESIFSLPINVFIIISSAFYISFLMNIPAKRFVAPGMFRALFVCTLLASLLRLIILLVHLGMSYDPPYQILNDVATCAAWILVAMVIRYEFDRGVPAHWTLVLFWVATVIVGTWQMVSSIRYLTFNRYCPSCITYIFSYPLYVAILILGIYTKYTRTTHPQAFLPKPKHPEDERLEAVKQVSLGRYLRDILFPHKWLLIVCLSISFLEAGLEMLPYLIMGWLLNDGTAPFGNQSVRYHALLLTGIYLIISLVSGLKTAMFDIFGAKVGTELKSQTFEAMCRQEQGWMDQKNTGDLMSRLSNDTMMISNTISVQIASGIMSIFLCIVSVITLFIINWRLTLVMLSTAPLVVVAMAFQGKLIRVYARDATDKLAAATQKAEEAISSMKTVRSFARDRFEKALYSNRLADTYALFKKMSIVDGVGTAFVFLTINVTSLLGLWFGSTLVARGEMNVGTLFTVLLYSFNMTMYVSQLPALALNFATAMGAATTVFNIFDRTTKMPIHAGMPLPTNATAIIECKSVWFAYPTHPEKPVLKDFNMTVRPGEVIALVGRSGSGKSTVFNLLERLYDVDQGEVTFGGYNVQQLDLVSLRRNIGIVRQEPALFNRSIAENITYGIKDPRKTQLEMVVAAARHAYAHDFIMEFYEKKKLEAFRVIAEQENSTFEEVQKRFPVEDEQQKIERAYKMVVGDRGSLLSGGQRQRIVIARIMLADPPLLLLDEATSALDAESEYYVQQALDTLMKKKTCIVIAHRINTIKNATRLEVVYDGKVIESGTYEELLLNPESEFAAINREAAAAAQRLAQQQQQQQQEQQEQQKPDLFHL